MISSAVWREVGLGERLADVDALRQQEGVGHAAADDELVDLGERGSSARGSWSKPWRRRRAAAVGRCGFSSTGAARRSPPSSTARRRTAGGASRLRSRRARGARAENASSTKMSPSLRKLVGELRVVLFLALVKAQVFENGDLARASARRPPPAASGPMQSGTKARRRGPVMLGRASRRPAATKTPELGPALGPSEVRDHDDLARRVAPDPRDPAARRSSRVASVTSPSFTGTLRSARTSTRLPLPRRRLGTPTSGVRDPFVFRRLPIARRRASSSRLVAIALDAPHLDDLLGRDAEVLEQLGRGRGGAEARHADEAIPVPQPFVPALRDAGFDADARRLPRTPCR